MEPDNIFSYSELDTSLKFYDYDPILNLDTQTEEQEKLLVKAIKNTLANIMQNPPKKKTYKVVLALSDPIKEQLYESYCSVQLFNIHESAEDYAIFLTLKFNEPFMVIEK